MNTTTQAPTQNTDPNSIPVLRFKRHGFEALCFDTYGCKVTYANMLQKDTPKDKKSPSFWGMDWLQNRNGGGEHSGIQNFPPPAHVSWRSKDGTFLTADIDIGAIFKDEVALHKVPLKDLAPTVTPGGLVFNPSIVLLVNDRNIKVFMQTFVSTKFEQIPGNKYSYARNDLMLAYDQDF